MHHLAATKRFLMFCDLQLMLVWQNANAKKLKAGRRQRFLPPPSDCLLCFHQRCDPATRPGRLLTFLKIVPILNRQEPLAIRASVRVAPRRTCIPLKVSWLIAFNVRARMHAEDAAK